MNARDVLKELKSLGTAQNRKVYTRHGVTGTMFGVSYANLEKVRKKIKTDHAVAEALWKSGNHDARVLAAKVADPEKTTAKQLEAWLKDVDNYVLADAFSGIASKSPAASACAKKWVKSKKEFVSSVGWSVMGALAEAGALTAAELKSHLATIEKTIHSAPNRTRYAMNLALICFGLQGAQMQKAAIAAAKRIGKVEVDHGETGCKTPDAAPYILKAAAHREKLAAARQARKKAMKKATKKARSRS